MDTIVNPLKSSVKTVGHAVKHVPENLRSLSHDGMSRLRGVSSNFLLLYFLFEDISLHCCDIKTLFS